MLSCFKYSVINKIKQRHFNEIYSKMHILTEKRITTLCSKLLNDSDEINHTQHKNRGDNYESIHKKISVCVLGQFLAKKLLKI